MNAGGRTKRLFTLILLAVVFSMGAFAHDERQRQKTGDAQAVMPLTDVIAEGPAAEALETLPIKGRAPKTGYKREQFGPGWDSPEGCSTRERILRRDLTNITLDPNNCKILSGTLNDPYSGKTIQFIRGPETSDDVQIEHVVALSDAWQKGAQALDYPTRVAFANDPLELLAVDGPTNQDKSDSDAASWLPPNKSFRCKYVARQIAVKLKYKLWVTQAEHNAMKTVLSDCPGEQLPTE